MKKIPLTQKNIPFVAADLGVSEADLINKIYDAELRYKKKCDMEFILNFFNADENWYKKTRELLAKHEFDKWCAAT